MPMTEEYRQAYAEEICEALMMAGDLQEFLWAEESWTLREFDLGLWVSLFQKRVDKISDLRPDIINSNWKVELRKRLLQQAALSIKAIMVLQNLKTEQLCHSTG